MPCKRRLPGPRKSTTVKIKASDLIQVRLLMVQTVTVFDCKPTLKLTDKCPAPGTNKYTLQLFLGKSQWPEIRKEDTRKSCRKLTRHKNKKVSIMCIVNNIISYNVNRHEGQINRISLPFLTCNCFSLTHIMLLVSTICQKNVLTG